MGGPKDGSVCPDPLFLAFPILSHEMLKDPTSVIVRDRALVAGQADQDRHPKSVSSIKTRTAPPRRPNKVLGRGAGKVTSAKRSTRRKPTLRRSRLRVLVVDDVPDVTEMIALFLKHAGYDVATADSAPMALQLTNERTFDLIISDIGMPEMNGYELAEALRGHADYQGIPMIAVTGYSEYDDRARALRCGFSAHLTKPIDPTQLLNLMNELLG
jgi:CheY-like chemotaxis protein